MGAVGVWGLLAEAPARSETLEGPWRPLTEQGTELWATQGRWACLLGAGQDLS